jgi:DNA-binding GntR family transcriptional regulator
MAAETPPKYRQIADDLRARMEAGEYPPDSRLPSKAELMSRYHVALATVNSAIGELRRLGLAETIQGVGTFARKPPPDESSAEYRELVEQIRLLAERMDGMEARLDEYEKSRGDSP